MEIGLIDVDSHNFPNLALMKISAYHKSHGDHVEWWNGLKHYDRVYQSKVFSDIYSSDIDHVVMADEVIKGGTGYDLKNVLPDEIEHQYPDYSIYGITQKSFGFLTRGCPRGCPFCIVKEKEGNTHTVADLDEFWRGQKEIVIMDSNITASKDCKRLFRQLIESKSLINFEGGLDIRFIDEEKTHLLNQIRVKEIHFAWDRYDDEISPRNLREYTKHATRKPHGTFGMVYVLTNFDTTIEQDLERIYKLREWGFDPYVMVFDKSSAPMEIRLMQRWVNNKWVFKQCDRFEDYDKFRKWRGHEAVSVQL